MVSEHRFLLDCLLSNSATHYTSLTNNPKTAQLALYYRNQGLIGLRHAVSNFSESNADALIAASILLIWYAYDWYVSLLMLGRYLLFAHHINDLIQD
jgi:hypothetical protein